MGEREVRLNRRTIQRLRLEASAAQFMRKYGRKSGKRYAQSDPNDRQYDRKVEFRLKRMAAEDLDALLHGGGVESRDIE